MKKLFLACLPALLLSQTALSNVAQAQDTMQMPSVEVRMRITLTPFNLAYLAYQGYFKNQGIPDAADLMQGFNDGSITATQLVEAAVKDKRLPAAFLKNSAYISAVNNQLFSLALTH